jgi:hypothetical protein
VLCAGMYLWMTKNLYRIVFSIRSHRVIEKLASLVRVVAKYRYDESGPSCDNPVLLLPASELSGPAVVEGCCLSIGRQHNSS